MLTSVNSNPSFAPCWLLMDQQFLPTYVAVSLTVTLMDFYLIALEVGLVGVFNFLFSANFVSSPNPCAA